MSRNVLGIDVGTSFVKFSLVVWANSEKLKSWYVPSPKFTHKSVFDKNYTNSIISIIYQNINSLLNTLTSNGQILAGVAVTGISPVLILFDPDSPDNVIALPYWLIPKVDNGKVGIYRTINRVNYLKNLGIFSRKKQIVCDLLGYINYRLTGKLTFNSITAGEMGFLDHFSFDKILNVGSSFLDISPPSFICGLLTICSNKKYDTPVFVGAPDSFATALSSGAVHAGSHMIYLGTFGSLLKVKEDIFELSNCSRGRPHLPYKWEISVPKFGKSIENFSTEICKNTNVKINLEQFDQIASNAPPGARGLFFHLPMWNSIGLEHGSFGFIGEQKSKALVARSILESLGYIIKYYSNKHVEKGQKRLWVSGGGGSSFIWRKILSNTIGVPLVSNCNSKGAYGACLIAGIGLKIIDKTKLSKIKIYTTNPCAVSYKSTDQTFSIASHWYDGYSQIR